MKTKKSYFDVGYRVWWGITSYHHNIEINKNLIGWYLNGNITIPLGMNIFLHNRNIQSIMAHVSINNSKVKTRLNDM